MTIRIVDPIHDPRWHAFVNQHPDASIFHTPGWLDALKSTYKFEPVAYTTAPEGEELKDAIVLCNVNSWLTGKRSVSLPFSDHCRPLVTSQDATEELLAFIHAEGRRNHLKFVELRPFSPQATNTAGISGFWPHRTYCMHVVDLSGSTDDILRKFGKGERNAIRRAEREALDYQSGRSEALLRDFYRLFVRTRRQHGVPPQPYKWFVNLLNCMGDQIKVRTASKDNVPVAAMITLSFKKTIVYKYACSESRFNKLGTMPFLCWKAIEEGKSGGATEFDLGRSDLHQDGLIAFKDRLGGKRYDLVYYRDSNSPKSHDQNHLASKAKRDSFYKKLLPVLPDRLFILAGELLYRHVG